MSEQMRSFALFVLGALLFVVTFEADWFARQVTGENRAMLCSAFFGLPYLFWEFTRKINWLIVLYLVLLVSTYFYIAIVAGGSVGEQLDGENAALAVGGAVGGLVGGALCLFTLKFGSLAGPGATTRNALAGSAVLAVLAGVGAYLVGLGVGGALSAALCLFLPWQLALGWFISRMMRISPARGA